MYSSIHKRFSQTIAFTETSNNCFNCNALYTKGIVLEVLWISRMLRLSLTSTRYQNGLIKDHEYMKHSLKNYEK